MMSRVSNNTEHEPTPASKSLSPPTKIPLPDPRLRQVPAPAPPAPRISANSGSSIAERIKYLQETCKRRPLKSNDNKAKLEINSVQIGKCESPSKTPVKTPPIVSSSSSVTGKASRDVFSPSGDPGSSSPYSPFDYEEEKKNISAKITKYMRPESSKEVIEKFSSFLKTREDSAEKYKKKFYELRKLYDGKKAELSAVQDHVKELRKKENALTNEKSGMASTLENFEKENRLLHEKIQALEMQNQKIRHEKEDSSVGTLDLSSKLNYTQVALDGQKLLFDMQKQRLTAFEEENADLKKKLISQQVMLDGWIERANLLEAAVREDVEDKNMVVAAFNMFMAKTQTRVLKIFEVNAPASGEDGRKEGPGNEPPPGPMSMPPSSVEPVDNASNNATECPVINPTPASNVHKPPTSAPSLATVKTEKLSPEKGEQEQCNGGQKRKEPVKDDDTDSTDSVVFISSSESSTPGGSKLPKKQKCE